MFERLAIVGAGAIGSYLARAGHDVTLTDPWAAHVATISPNPPKDGV